VSLCSTVFSVIMLLSNGYLVARYEVKQLPVQKVAGSSLIDNGVRMQSVQRSLEVHRNE
jgi:hypothetical protein